MNNRKELQNISINHSADICYNNFMRIYRGCARKPYSFLRNDAALPASDPFSILIKMTATDQIKILDRKIMQNEAQYDLYRKADKYPPCFLMTLINMNI